MAALSPYTMVVKIESLLFFIFSNPIWFLRDEDLGNLNFGHEISKIWKIIVPIKNRTHSSEKLTLGGAH
jgi:hypothetical protein